MSNFLKLKHVHVNKDRVKASFDITLKKVTNLSEYNGKQVSITWKRGKRATNTGSLREVLVDRGEAVWDEKVVVQVTLFKDVGGDKFEEKSLNLQIMQGSKTIGKLRIDLGEIAKSDGSTVLEFPLSKKQSSPVLYMLVHARWLKLNDRLLVRLEDGQGADHAIGLQGQGQGPGAAGAGKPSLEIDGQPYNLKTDDALTDPSVDTTSGSWEGDDNDNEDDDAKEHYHDHHGNMHDPFTQVSVFEAETRKVQDELETIRKQLRLVEGQSSERAKTIELQEKEILALRGKVVESEEMVQRAMNMEGFMDQQLALLRQEHDDAMQQLKQQHSKELETEVDRHREELETALTRAQLCLLSPSLPHNSTATSKELDTMKAERDSLAKERDALIKEREGLQHKVRLVTRELEESTKSLLVFTEQLSDRDEKISRLKDETKSLYLSLANVTLENQTLKEGTQHTPTSEDGLGGSAPSRSEQRKQVSLGLRGGVMVGGGGGGVDVGTGAYQGRPQKPLFAHPFVDKHWDLLYLFFFGLVLALHHVLFAAPRSLNC